MHAAGAHHQPNAKFGAAAPTWVRMTDWGRPLRNGLSPQILPASIGTAAPFSSSTSSPPPAPLCQAQSAFRVQKPSVPLVLSGRKPVPLRPAGAAMGVSGGGGAVPTWRVFDRRFVKGSGAQNRTLVSITGRSLRQFRNVFLGQKWSTGRPGGESGETGADGRERPVALNRPSQFSCATCQRHASFARTPSSLLGQG